MREFDINYRDIKLRVICKEDIETLITNHYMNHAIITLPEGVPSYTVIVDESNNNEYKGIPYKMIDKWFDNATLDCYIDNNNSICYINNINYSKGKYRELIIQYFITNLFNRMLELEQFLGIHSSCVEKDNNGVLFVAERYNGKTICMLNLMNYGYNSITNDIIALKKIKNDIIGYGIAQSVSIRLGPTFCSQKENKKYVDLAKSKGIELKDKEMIEGNSMLITDSELAKINNVSQSMESPISFIVRPCYNPFVDHPTFDRMSVDQLRELLYSQYRSLVHETTDFLINVKPKDINEKERYNNFENLVEIPAYYCHQNERTTQEFVDNIENIRKLCKR